METPEIVSQVAELMSQKAVWAKDPSKAVKVLEKYSEPAKDQVELTQAGAQYAQSTGSSSDAEVEQAMKVERLKSLVQSGNYHLDKNMVNRIASNIAKMFV